MLDPTLIRRDMTPDKVLAAMLPVVRDAFERGIGPSLMHARRQHRHMAILFAAHVLPALMDLLQYQSRFGITCPPTCYPEVDRRIAAVDAALTAFRDAWCAAAEGAEGKETK